MAVVKNGNADPTVHKRYQQEIGSLSDLGVLYFTIYGSSYCRIIGRSRIFFELPVRETPLRLLIVHCQLDSVLGASH
jgi:hypothetical protein